MSDQVDPLEGIVNHPVADVGIREVLGAIGLVIDVGRHSFAVE